MNKGVLFFGAVTAGLVAVLAISGSLGGITGLLSESSQPFDFARSIQVGVVLLASLGILVITLLNVTHQEEENK